MSLEEYEVYMNTELISYSEQLIIDVDDLLNSKTMKLNFDYFDNKYKINDKVFYRTHKNNTRTFMKMLLKDSKTKEYKYKDYDDVYFDEYKWFSLCYNGGLTYLKKEGKYYDTYGYDFKMSYPTDMASIAFQMPTKRGEEKTLKELPPIKFVSFGIYRVKITSDNEKFKKTFMFSKNNGYTSESLKYALRMSKKFDINIELIHDGKPNAYIYDRKCLVSGNKLFGNWYYRLCDMKKEMPKNGIVKLLSSSAWGHCNELRTIFKTEEEVSEMLEQGITISSDMDGVDYEVIKFKEKEDGSITYELLDTKKPVYELPFRLLPFITSFSRVKMGNLINKYDLYDKLIRIQTDSMTMTEEFTENIEGFVLDAKISGDLEFKHLNEYHKIIKDINVTYGI